jgi:hypothetical protein
MTTKNGTTTQIESTTLSGRPRESGDPELIGARGPYGRTRLDSRLRGNDRSIWHAFASSRLFVCAAVSAILAAGTVSASAQSYPNRPIRIVVPTQAGAAQDILARLMQPHLEKALGQPVIVENRSGASTMIGTEAVAKAAPDGHTLLIVPTTFTVNAALNTKLSFDLERDF